MALRGLQAREQAACCGAAALSARPLESLRPRLSPRPFPGSLGLGATARAAG